MEFSEYESQAQAKPSQTSGSQTPRLPKYLILFAYLSFSNGRHRFQLWTSDNPKQLAHVTG